MDRVRTGLLDVAYESGGAADGKPVLLLHGWPDDASAWRAIAPAFAAAGYRWVAPYLRGFGPTRFLSDSIVRDATGVALAQDGLDLVDALGWDRFAVVGRDWGGRAAYFMAALAPSRVTAIAALAVGYAPRGRFEIPSFEQARCYWYQWFMCSDAGADFVRSNPIAFARAQWDMWGPTVWFDDDEFSSVATSFANPDWVDVTLHSYRSRWCRSDLDPRYAPQRGVLEATDKIHVPTLMVQGAADRCLLPSETEGQAAHFDGRYERVVLDGIGHFPAREAPRETGEAVLGLLKDEGA